MSVEVCKNHAVITDKITMAESFKSIRFAGKARDLKKYLSFLIYLSNLSQTKPDVTERKVYGLVSFSGKGKDFKKYLEASREQLKLMEIEDMRKNA